MSSAVVVWRAAHGLIAIAFLASIGYVWRCALSGRRGPLLRPAIAALVGEGVLVAANGGDCPLGPMGDRIGDAVPLFSGNDSATVRLFGPNGYSVTFAVTSGGFGNEVSRSTAGTPLAAASDPAGGDNLIEGASFIAVAPPGLGDRTLAGHVSAEVNNDGNDCTFGVNAVGG